MQFSFKMLVFYSLFSLQAFATNTYKEETSSGNLTQNEIERGKARPARSNKNVRIRIIHTNDIHSSTDILPKLSAFIERQKSIAIQEGIFPIVDDAGDFFSGSILHTLAPRHRSDGEILNPELEFLRRHGFTSILGNHEWDATQEGLAVMFSKLKGERSFPGGVLASNMILENPQKGENNALAPYFFHGIMLLDSEYKVVKAYSLNNDNTKIQELNSELPQHPLTSAVIRTYKVANQEFKVGFIGVMGDNAVTGSVITRKGSGVSFKKYESNYVGRLVIHLRNLGAELVIADIHGGAEPPGVEGDQEDKILGTKIPGIDVVSAGHTHYGYVAKASEAPLIRYQSPAFGQAVVTDLSYDAKQGSVRTLKLENSKIIYKTELENLWDHSDDSYRGLAKITSEEIQHYKNEFDEIIKDDPRYSLESSLPIKHSHDLINLPEGSIAATELGDFSTYKTREPLGKFVMTAVREELNEALLLEKKHPVEIMMTGIELIRIPFFVGGPTIFEDIFAMNSRGVMKSPVGTLIPDGGRISVMRMSKKDLYRLVGLFEFYSRKYTAEATMSYSEGLEFTYLPNSIPIFFNLKDFKLNARKYKDLPEILHVAISSFIAQNIREKAGGLVDFSLIHQIDPQDHVLTTDVLLARYLHKNRSLIERLGVAGSASERAKVLAEQKKRWRKDKRAMIFSNSLR